MIFFISDTHFYHDNIIKYCNRPFRNVEEMNKTIIENWNSVVKPTDVVYHLGDFTTADYIPNIKFKDRYIVTARSLLSKLNGKKILIRGNHDLSKTVCLECGWDRVETEANERGMVLSHKPKKYINLVNIHGHIHNQKPFCYLDENGKVRFNVSVDVTSFKPVSIEQIENAYINKISEVYQNEKIVSSEIHYGKFFQFIHDKKFDILVVLKFTNNYSLEIYKTRSQYVIKCNGIEMHIIRVDLNDLKKFPQFLKDLMIRYGVI